MSACAMPSDAWHSCNAGTGQYYSLTDCISMQTMPGNGVVPVEQ
jgi:hypothetical protein